MLRFAILTVSDRSFSGVRPDLSGPALVNAISDIAGLLLKLLLSPMMKSLSNRN